MRRIFRRKPKNEPVTECQVTTHPPNATQRPTGYPGPSRTHYMPEGLLDEAPERNSEQRWKAAIDTEASEGLIEIKSYSAHEGDKTRIDIVAVHGLNGHPFKTWTERGVIWFSDILPKSLALYDLRVFTFGYNSKVLFSGTTLGVRGFATQLLNSLDLKRKQTFTEKVPIIFICHSLGGVVFKKMLIMAHERESLYNDIKISTKSVIFLGTPHGGSGVASLTRVLRDIFNICTGGSVRADLLQNLETKSADLMELAEQFVERGHQLKIVTVYEGRPLKPAPASFPVVVDKRSAVLNLQNERVIPVDADHRGICRFSSAEDPRFQSVLLAVSNVVRESISLEDSKLKVCINMLYFPSYKQRRSNVVKPHVDTFSWIWDHSKYQTWENGRASSLLWLRGKPGSGKSTLANFVRAKVHDHVERQPDTRSIVVDFFYSARGGSIQNGHYWMLRSVLYQLLLKAPELWDSYLHDFIECRQIEQSDEWRNSSKSTSAGEPPEHLWSFDQLKHIFYSLGSIHAPGMHITAYIIIDALDESEEPHRQDMIQMFRNASMHHPTWPITFKIFLTSRPSPKIELLLQDRLTIILEDETQGDIVEYVSSETNRIKNAFPKCGPKELAYVSSHLIEWAEGVFLWVSLVLFELDEAVTGGFSSMAELKLLLESIPKELGQLYERIMTKIRNGLPRAIRECQTVFRWVAFAPKPLTIEQMLEIVAASACSDSQLSGAELKRWRVGSTDDMRKRLISLCGNLVEVKGGEVQFIHTSVREFLLENVCDGTVSLVRGESLFEIASLCTEYVECFHNMIRETPNSFVGEEAGLEGIDPTSYASHFANLINQLILLRFTFGCDKKFLIELEHELRIRAQDRSLRDTMSATCISLRPTLIDTILRGKVATLDRLILYADQINALYQVPLHNKRFNLTLAGSGIIPKYDFHATPLHMMSFLQAPWSLDVVDLLHKHGANLNFQDDLGRTPLCTAVQAGAWLYRRLSDIVYQRSMPTIDKGIINPRTPFLELCRCRDATLRDAIQAMDKPCIVISSAAKYGTNQQLREKLGASIPLENFLESAAKTGDKSLWAMVWSLRSAHAKLSKTLVNGFGETGHNPFILREIGRQTNDKELRAVLQGLTYIRALVSRLLNHGADPIVTDYTPSTVTALELAVDSGDQEIIFNLLSTMRQQTEFKLSPDKTAAEKSGVLQPVASLLARIIYREIADQDSEHVLAWLFKSSIHDPNFIFGSKSVNLLELYTGKGGGNAMHVAAAKGNVRAIGLMIPLGFKKDVLDALGRSPWDLAELEERLKVLFLLMSEGERMERRIIWSWQKVGWQLTR